MVWKQVGNCLQNLKFTMISIDFIVRNKLKQSNVCKEINFINYINVYLNKKQSVSCLKWSTQYMRGICFIWFPLLMNELMVKSWSQRRFTTPNVASMNQVFVFASSSNWWSEYTRRWRCPEASISMWLKSGMFACIKLLSRWSRI